MNGSSKQDEPPKLVHGNKTYGRRSKPDIMENLEDIHDEEEHTAESADNQMEASESLRAIWNELAVGKNGYLNLNDLELVCKHIGMEDMVEEDLVQLFEKLDSDKDGMVSFQEFLTGLYQHSSPSGTPVRMTPLKSDISRRLRASTTPDGHETPLAQVVGGRIEGFFGPSGIFSELDGRQTGFASLEAVVHYWVRLGLNYDDCMQLIENYEYDADTKISLLELTSRLEEEIAHGTPSDIGFVVALTTYRHEIRHLKSSVDQLSIERTKLRSSLAESELRNQTIIKEVEERHAQLELVLQEKIESMERQHKERVRQLEGEVAAHMASSGLTASGEVAGRPAEAAGGQARDQLMAAAEDKERLRGDLIDMQARLIDAEATALRLQNDVDMLNDAKVKTENLAEKRLKMREDEHELVVQKLHRAQAENKELRDKQDELNARLERVRGERAAGEAGGSDGRAAGLLMVVPDAKTREPSRTGSLLSKYTDQVVITHRHLDDEQFTDDADDEHGSVVSESHGSSFQKKRKLPSMPSSNGNATSLVQTLSANHLALIKERMDEIEELRERLADREQTLSQLQQTNSQLQMTINDWTIRYNELEALKQTDETRLLDQVKDIQQQYEHLNGLHKQKQQDIQLEVERGRAVIEQQQSENRALFEQVNSLLERLKSESKSSKDEMVNVERQHSDELSRIRIEQTQEQSRLRSELSNQLESERRALRDQQVAVDKERREVEVRLAAEVDRLNSEYRQKVLNLERQLEEQRLAHMNELKLRLSEQQTQFNQRLQEQRQLLTAERDQLSVESREREEQLRTRLQQELAKQKDAAQAEQQTLMNMLQEKDADRYNLVKQLHADHNAKLEQMQRDLEQRVAEEREQMLREFDQEQTHAADEKRALLHQVDCLLAGDSVSNAQWKVALEKLIEQRRSIWERDRLQPVLSERSALEQRYLNEMVDLKRLADDDRLQMEETYQKHLEELMKRYEAEQELVEVQLKQRLQDTFNREIDRLREKHEDEKRWLTEQNQRLDKQLATVRHEYDVRVRSLQLEMSQTSTEADMHESYISKIESLNSQLVLLQQTNRQQSDRLSSLEFENHTLQSKVDSLTFDSSSHRSGFDKLQKQNAELQRLLRGQDATATAAKPPPVVDAQQVTRLEAELQQVRKKLSDTTQQLYDASTKLMLQSMQNQRLDVQMGLGAEPSAAAEPGDVREQLQKERTKNLTLTQSLDRLKRNYEDLLKENRSDNKRTLHQLDLDNAELRIRLSGLRKMMQQQVLKYQQQLEKHKACGPLIRELAMKNAQLAKALQITEEREKSAEQLNDQLDDKFRALQRVVVHVCNASLGR